MTRRIINFALPVALIVAAVVSIAAARLPEQNTTAKTQRRLFDENRFPIADLAGAEPADAAERLKRSTRGKKYDNSDWRVHPDTVSDSTVRVDSGDPNLPALPFQKSSAVVVGQVTDAHAYLSNDKTGVYSVFTFQVNEVLKNSSSVRLTTASTIEVERDGGRVRFPNGRLHLYMISEQDMPQVGQRYVLFLTGGSDGSVFEIVTGYELRDGRVYSLDNLRNARKYDGRDEASFVSKLRKSDVSFVAAIDNGQFARRVVCHVNALFRGLKLVTIDNLSGYEILAKGKDTESSTPLTVYLVLLYEDQSYYIMQGLVSVKASETYVPVFKEMARSFKRRK